MRVTLDYTAEVAGTGLLHDFFARIAEETMKRLPAELCGTKEQVTLSAVLVSPDRIQELNRTYSFIIDGFAGFDGCLTHFIA